MWMAVIFCVYDKCYLRLVLVLECHEFNFNVSLGVMFAVETVEGKIDVE